MKTAALQFIFAATTAIAQDYDPAGKIKHGQPKPFAILIDRTSDFDFMN